MKKTNLIALALCAVLTFSLFTAFSVGATDEYYNQETIPKVLVLGDSIAQGYGLPDYVGEGSIPKSAYASLFSAEIGAAGTVDLASSGTATEHTIRFLKNETFIENIQKSSVITLSMGSNDILGPGQTMIVEALGLSSTSEIASAFAAENANAIELLKKISEYAKKDEQAAKFVSAVEKFKENWVTIIDMIYAINPDAILIVTNFYNPYKPMSMLASYGVDIDVTVDTYLGQMNEFIASHEYNGEKYFIADVVEVGNNKTNVNLVTKNVDPHPNTEGHAYIASAVLAAYKIALEKDTSDETGATELPNNTENLPAVTETLPDTTKESTPDCNTSFEETTTASPSETTAVIDTTVNVEAEVTTSLPVDTTVTENANTTDAQKSSGCAGIGTPFACVALLFTALIGTALSIVIKKK